VKLEKPENDSAVAYTHQLNFDASSNAGKVERYPLHHH
jgi:hypothetical protein